MKIKLRKSDILFSKFIRLRDKYTCQSCQKKYYPPTQGLHCSHFYSRRFESTRFDPENCVALCFPCHQKWGGDDREDYKSFMVKRLGQAAFDKLTIRAKVGRKKRDDKLDILYAKVLLDEL